MPYYTWRGIDLTGTIRAGVTQAISVQELDQHLLRSEIALLHSRQSPWWRLQPIRSSDILETIESLAQLLQSGVVLTQALDVLVSQSKMGRLQAILSDVARFLHEGKPFHVALEQHTGVFDPFLIHLVHVGESSGALSESLQTWCIYTQELQSFKKQIRQALLMPAITLAVFLCISIVIFVVILPMFATMFQSAGQSLPPLTEFMLGISAMLSGYGLAVFGAALLLFVLIYKYICTFPRVNYCFDWLWLHMPLTGGIISLMQEVALLQTVGTLLTKSVPILLALDVAKYRVTNSVVKEKLLKVYGHVEQGISLSAASLQERLFLPETILLLVVGEESGALGRLMLRAAELAKQKLYKRLQVIAYSVQPLLLIVLGLLITGLIVAVYVPILSLSYSLG